MTTDTSQTPSRSAADRFARQVLLIEDAAPRSIVSLRGSLVITAVRCVLMYAIIPLLVPVVGWLGVIATPISLAMSFAAVGLSIYSLRRVWLADYQYRWPYTGFIAAVLALLAVVIALDIRTLLA